MSGLNVWLINMLRGSRLLMWTRWQDRRGVSRSREKVHPFHFERAEFLSRLSCYACVQLRHSLIHNSCRLLTHSRGQRSPTFLAFRPHCSGNCNFKTRSPKICLDYSILHSANGVREAPCYFQADCLFFRHFAGSSCNSPRLVIHFTVGMQEQPLRLQLDRCL